MRPLNFKKLFLILCFFADNFFFNVSEAKYLEKKVNKKKSTAEIIGAQDATDKTLASLANFSNQIGKISFEATGYQGQFVLTAVQGAALQTLDAVGALEDFFLEGSEERAKRCQPLSIDGVPKNQSDIKKPKAAQAAAIKKDKKLKHPIDILVTIQGHLMVQPPKRSLHVEETFHLPPALRDIYTSNTTYGARKLPFNPKDIISDAKELEKFDKWGNTGKLAYIFYGLLHTQNETEKNQLCAEMGKSLSVNEQLTFLQRFAGRFIEQGAYETIRRTEWNTQTGNIVCSDILKAMRENDEKGVCRDVTYCKMDLLQCMNPKLKIPMDGVCYPAPPGWHCVEISSAPKEFDPKTGLRVFRLTNYGKQQKVSGLTGTQLGDQTSTINVGDHSWYFDSEGHPTAVLPTRLGLAWNLASGGDHRDFGEMSRLASLRTNIGTVAMKGQHGQELRFFVAPALDGTGQLLVGLAGVQKWKQVKEFKSAIPITLSQEGRVSIGAGYLTEQVAATEDVGSEKPQRYNIGQLHVAVQEKLYAMARYQNGKNVIQAALGTDLNIVGSGHIAQLEDENGNKVNDIKKSGSGNLYLTNYADITIEGANIASQTHLATQSAIMPENLSTLGPLVLRANEVVISSDLKWSDDLKRNIFGLAVMGVLTSYGNLLTVGANFKHETPDKGFTSHINVLLPSSDTRPYSPMGTDKQLEVGVGGFVIPKKNIKKIGGQMMMVAPFMPAIPGEAKQLPTTVNFNFYLNL